MSTLLGGIVLDSPSPSRRVERRFCAISGRSPYPAVLPLISITRRLFPTASLPRRPGNYGHPTQCCPQNSGQLREWCAAPSQHWPRCPCA